MADKVLAIIRETLLHENTVEGIAFDPASGELLLTLIQPNETADYPEHELQLTFAGVHSFAVDEAVHGTARMVEVLGIDCTLERGDYVAEIAIGDSGVRHWVMRLTFAGLTYRRSHRYP